MKIPERKAFSHNGTGSSSSAVQAGLLAPFSQLWAFLTGFDPSTGISRQSGNLSLKLQSGLLGLTLNDPETCQYAFLHGESLDDLLLLAECGLSDGTLPWRPSNYSVPKKKGK
jgi:hypothetical protein